jgi:integrase
MATRRGNPDQYLQKIGNTFYARVRVPRTLEKFVGQTHIRRTLETSERAEANRRKHAVVGKIKNELAAFRRSPPTAKDRGLSFADAREWREEFRRLEATGDVETHSTLSDVLTTRAEEIERLYGTNRAQRWYRAASRTGDTLLDLMDKWLGAMDYKESTNHGHRKALEEVLAHIDNNEAHPADVTRQVAIDYIDNSLMKRGLAANTIRDRLVSLGGFWTWMASRDAVRSGANPWSGHRVSKSQNKGTRPPRRAYSEAELLQLLNAPPEVRRWPTFAYLPDLIVLGMATGARIESLCALTVPAVKLTATRAIVTITGDKTQAGTRPVGITHPAALSVLKRRAAAAKKSSTGLLFGELSPGGYDKKMSAAATKAFGRYRRACGVPDGPDFHSFRRNVITMLEAAGVGQVPIARFVGHKVGTMAADTYSAGGSESLATEVSRKVRYSRQIEGALAKVAQP